MYEHKSFRHVLSLCTLMLILSILCRSIIDSGKASIEPYCEGLSFCTHALGEMVSHLRVRQSRNKVYSTLCLPCNVPYSESISAMLS